MNAQALGELGRRGDGSAPLVVGGCRLANRVLLAPMSGVSDVPFRRLARRFGAGLVVSEMVASGEYLKGDGESTLRALRDGHGIHAVQLAGRDPVAMGEAARRLADSGADIVDINFGCPAKKVVGGLSGSALMREPELALAIVEAVVEGAGAVPVTVKMRLGWDRASMNAPWLAARAEAAGARMVTVHGRTRMDFYDGSADWKAIAAVRRAITVPLVANGDLVSTDRLGEMLASSGADAVMVGRGAYGRPWLPGLMAGATTMAALSRIDLGDFAVGHYEAMLGHYGLPTGIRHARKHLGWYLDRFRATGAAVSPAERRAIMTGTDPNDVRTRLSRLFAGTTLAEIETAATAPMAEAA
ncbi:tRNA dihydrouridine synthase DusB [Jiella avicenniae]|uniref:tRNA-dihydrouridine synthase n=1 Tax=Jiella avicenniae TaxID=2907202 RepID=A0A9X1P1B0_9HYPH|nr:tRNA dihydrouridine synthase DusB [Jiella avicenniae]MCE7028019.1 tRNA dihydrouridine synthase DusB [Jiella avicenniae]